MSAMLQSETLGYTFYLVKRVLLYGPDDKQDLARDIELESSDYDSLCDDDEDDADGQEQEEVEPSLSEKVVLYREALAAWRKKSSHDARLWEDVEWMTFAIMHPRTETFLIRQHWPDCTGNQRNAIMFRRAIVYSLRCVERFRGKITIPMHQASSFLLACGYVKAVNIPDDLWSRVDACIEKLKGMDEEDLALAYCGGAHWMVHEFRDLETMKEPLRNIGYQLDMVPVIRRLKK